MSDLVHIDSGQDGELAVLLLDAADTLNLDPSVVRTTSEGFVVPRAVAVEAGIESDDDDVLSFSTKKEAEEYADQHGIDVDKSLSATAYKAAVVAAGKGE
jgi:hypothetical protein